ncbi:uncharacterized protein LOC128723977 [Anopheles nili]|uniref:uncharacterized protein LOC128723977 n=1 Tax=Anopheles nili TaxID=185578 RepID=UPI00237A0F27|nr:uncharacterized protein LOC128723977 [Anopheles nili]
MVDISFIIVVVLLLGASTGNCKAQIVSDCVRSTPESARNIVCDVRQYRAVRTPESDRYVKCALTALGFVDEAGSVQRNVVLVALDAVETHDGVYTDSVDVCLSRSRKLPGAERPGAFYFCMLQTESAQNFQDALELQELKTASEWAQSELFDRAKVQQKMREMNSKLQCK